MDKVDFFSFKDAPKSLKVEWGLAIAEVVESGIFIGGPAVAKFEFEWSKYLDAKHAIGVGNGYDALVVALKILGVGPGDLVAVPSHTFIATWLAVDAVGATPVGIDCNEYGLMDLESLEMQTSSFAAVIPVHMHGQMVEMPRLIKWAAKKKVRVVEDCAQAHGARIDGKLAGTWGDFGAFSFYPTKNLGALGDAGSLVTNDDALATKARSFVNYGSMLGNKYKYQFHGVNSRLDPIQASILSVNLKHLEEWNEARKEKAKIYKIELERLGIETLPIRDESVFHHFVVKSENRNATKSTLEKLGIMCDVHYPEAAAESYAKMNKNFTHYTSENARGLTLRMLSLPMSPWLSKRDLDRVISAISQPHVLRTFTT
jgi:dTDP-4-amino-4,6-dideoxygalactose transaminase